MIARGLLDALFDFAVLAGTEDVALDFELVALDRAVDCWGVPIFGGAEFDGAEVVLAGAAELLEDVSGFETWLTIIP